MNRSLATLAAVAGALALTPAAAAEPGTGGPVVPPPAPPTLQVVARGLDMPRGLWVGPHGVVVVAEAGRAGDTPCLPASPGTGNQPACFSATGGLTLAWAGHQVRLAEGLPSDGATNGSASSGPHDVAVTPFGLEVLFGFANNPAGRPALGPAAGPLGTLSLLGPHQDLHLVGDLAAFEGAENPDGRPGFLGTWSNPYSMIPDGRDTLVSDSGANDILEVTPEGHVSTVAVMPLRQVPAPPPLGLPPGATIAMESVPTGMVRGPDGSVYVGELTGFPFPIGGARVYRVVPGAEPQVVASGFTNIIDVAFDHRGRLLVLEHATHSLLSGDPTGALKRVEADGTVTTLVGTGLVNPTAMTVGPDGAVYVSNQGTTADAGEVVRFVPPG
jgi:hypothetical protein